MSFSTMLSESVTCFLAVCLVTSIVNIYLVHFERDLRQRSRHLHDVLPGDGTRKLSLVQTKNKSVPIVQTENNYNAIISTTLNVSVLDKKGPPADPWINPHNFNIVKEPLELCEFTNIRYLIYVHSAPTNIRKRRMIRKTWASTTIRREYKIALMFVMGVVPDAVVMDMIKLESILYEDLLVEDSIDSYRNMTHKAVAALKWISLNCKHASHIIKTDDDIVVDIETLLEEMNTMEFLKHGQEKLIMCHTNVNATVFRDNESKWYTSVEEYADDIYPTYCAGAAYILSKDVVLPLYKASLKTKFFWVDDVYITGILREQLGLDIMPFIKYTFGNNQPIKLVLQRRNAKFLIFHYSKTQDGYRIWNSLNKK